MSLEEDWGLGHKSSTHTHKLAVLWPPWAAHQCCSRWRLKAFSQKFLTWAFQSLVLLLTYFMPFMLKIQHARLRLLMNTYKQSHTHTRKECSLPCVCVSPAALNKQLLPASWGKTAMRHIMRAGTPSSPFHSRLWREGKRENAVAKEMRSPRPPQGGVPAVGHGYLVAFSFLHFPPTDKLGSLRSIWFAVFLRSSPLCLPNQKPGKNIAN